MGGGPKDPQLSKLLNALFGCLKAAKMCLTFNILEFQGPYGPLRNSSPCGGLARFAHKLSRFARKLLQTYTHTYIHTETLLFMSDSFCIFFIFFMNCVHLMKGQSHLCFLLPKMRKEPKCL